MEEAPGNSITGWFIEPWTCVTSFLGEADDSEGLFEWLLCFAWTAIMDKIVGNKYVTVYLATETMTEGGLTQSDVTTLKLHKGLFQSNGGIGYYRFRYRNRSGMGDSEKLYMMCDGPMFLRSMKLCITNKTKKILSLYENYEDQRGLVEV